MAIDIGGLTPLLLVYDMPRALYFYRDILGFEIAQASPVLPEGYSHWVLLRLGSAELMLNTTYEFNSERPAEPDRARASAHGDTCLYFECADVDAVYEHLQGAGLNVNVPAVAPYGMRQLYVRGPDGYNLCFQWPVKA